MSANGQRDTNQRITLLGLFEYMLARQNNLTLLNEVEDPQALPLLKYWVSLPGAAGGKQQLQYNIDRLESRQKRAPSACCQPSETCLWQRVEQSAAPVKIATAEQAHRWLTTANVGKSDLSIRFQDELKRSAEVEGKAGLRQTWEFLYGCWKLAVEGCGGYSSKLSPCTRLKKLLRKTLHNYPPGSSAAALRPMPR